MSVIDDLVKRNKLKVTTFTDEMCNKEFEIGKRDYDSAQKSFEDGNFKWATIQAYYAIFHATRALLYKAGYREESHSALKQAFKELYIVTGKLPQNVYDALERGMDLREMADYKESYSQKGAENLMAAVKRALEELGKVICN